jgi:hypothetical protein
MVFHQALATSLFMSLKQLEDLNPTVQAPFYPKLLGIVLDDYHRNPYHLD